MSLEELFDTHGFYTEVVNGEIRYVTRDGEQRAVLGPRQHRKRGRLFTRRAPRRVEPAQNDVGVRNRHQRWRDMVIDVTFGVVGLSLSVIAISSAYWVVTQ
jgi:hypothetical protein